MTADVQTNTIRVFVHLARGFGRTAWKERWDRGEIVGINHEDPYGYRQAEQMGCAIEQSEDHAEGTWGRYFRLAMRAILGFDLVHALRNRKSMFAADVVWTHTESQALAVLFLLRLHPAAGRRVKLIAQTVWLIDSWESHSYLRRAFYRNLLQRADVLTFHSLPAVVRARQLFPDVPAELVKYGIRVDPSLAVIDREWHVPVRILAMGNDRHRDWPTLIAAIQNHPRYEAKAVTRAKIDELLANVKNVALEKASDNEELATLFGWADLVIVSLQDNFHASGITVIQEAVLCGIPVICTDVGGLRSYFSSDEVTYVQPNDPKAICNAIEVLMADGEARRAKAVRALARMRDGDVNSRSFVARHVELSSRLLRASATAQAPNQLSVAGERR
jgi:glycosyltransferase involved in cell wall biosynthesis